MARKFGLSLAWLALPWVGWAMTIGGSMSVGIQLLPTQGLDYAVFTLEAQVSGWNFGGTAEFLNNDGWVWQEITAQGSLGFGDASWTLLFGPQGPAFLYSLGEVSLEFGGVDFTVYSAYVGPNVPGYFFSGGPSGGLVVLAETELDGVSFSSVTGFGARLSPFTITYTGVGTYTKTYPVDPFPGGLRFIYQELSLTGVPFCCGITFDASLAFSKEEGFESLELSVHDVFPICCGITFDLGIVYTTEGKTIWAAPNWPEVEEACFQLYLDLESRGGENADLFLEAIRVDGWRIYCEIAECNWVELVSFLSPENAWLYGYSGVFQGEEFEYFKLGLCGPGCCGGEYQAEFAFYFRPSGVLFGLNRFTAWLSIPVMAGFAFEVSLEAGPGVATSLTAGWTFSF
ncbi:MAG TPA: hypothetical protein ENI38_00590 [Candidatus Acetothermia bacterium]|nr:hypothetical protein [Candidatus Acetothermia bacterium]